MTAPLRLPGPLIATGLFLAAFALYLATTSSSVLLEDDGLFIVAAWFDGIAHPPGYPLWTLLAHPFSQIPVGTVAFRVHAFSGLAAALCVPLLWSITLKLTGRQLPALTAALALALSQTFWSQAIVAEVYALNLLLLLALIRLLLVAYRPDTITPGAADPFTRLHAHFPRAWHGHLLVGLLALAYGLSLSNHWPLVGLTSFGLLVLALPWSTALLTRLPIAIVALGVGLLPYVWMVYHSQHNPLISFMGPIGYWHEFRSIVLREQYAGVDQSGTASYMDQLRYLGFIFKQWTVEFGFPGALLSIVGLAAYGRSGNPWITGALLLAILGNSLVLVALLGFDYDDLYASVFRVYPMVAWALLAVAIGLGLSAFQSYLSKRKVAHGDLITAGVAALVLLSSLAGSLPLNDRSDDSWAEDYARAVLEDVPEGAWVIVEQDTDTGPIAYLHMVRGVRPDITLFNAFGLLLPTRLGHPLRDGKQGIESAWSAIMGAYPPVPIVSVGNYQPGQHKAIRTWLYTQLAATPDAPRLSLRMSEAQYRYWDRIKDLPPLTDPWSKIHRQTLMANMGQLLAAKRYRDDPAHGFRPVEQDLADLDDSLFARLQILRIRLATGRYDADQVQRDFDAIRELITSTTIKSYHAQVYELLGTFHLREGRPNEALGGWVRSLEISPRPTNPATSLIRRLANKVNKPGLLDEIARRFPAAFPR